MSPGGQLVISSWRELVKDEFLFWWYINSVMHTGGHVWAFGRERVTLNGKFYLHW